MNSIKCGDCLELIKEIPDKSIDLIVTDPPYLIENTKAGGGSQLAKSIQKMNDEMIKKDTEIKKLRAELEGKPFESI